MSLSKKHRAYVKGGGKLNFADWSVLYDRMAVARAARGNKRTKIANNAGVPEVQAPIKARVQFERVANRVDCFAVKGGSLLMACDIDDLTAVKRVLGSSCHVGAPYTSKRGERVRFTTLKANARKLERAGFAVKGL